MICIALYCIVVHCTAFVTTHCVFLCNFNCNRWRDCGCTRKHSPQERSSLSMKESLQTQIWLPGNPSQIIKSPQSLDTEHASPSWRPEAETVQFTGQCQHVSLIWWSEAETVQFTGQWTHSTSPSSDGLRLKPFSLQVSGQQHVSLIWRPKAETVQFTGHWTTARLYTDNVSKYRRLETGTGSA